MRSIIAATIAFLATTGAASPVDPNPCTGFVVTENPDKNRCEFRFCNRPDRPEMSGYCLYPNTCIPNTPWTRCTTPEGKVIPAYSL